MVALSQAQVEAALARVEPGLRKYCSIQARLSCCDVSVERDFQRQFDHFYRVRRNEEWRKSFFRLMERAKRCGISFPQALDTLQRENGKFEVSFASKLVATVNPAKPVVDKYVRKHFNLSLPYSKAKDRFERAVNLYELLTDRFAELLASPTGSMILHCFDHRYADVDLTALKKVDLVLWQIRG